MYYPVSTFMFPNFQFADKGLDVKWDPAFLVVYVQVKLLIVATSSFFHSYDPRENRILSYKLLILLALLNHYFII